MQSQKAQIRGVILNKKYFPQGLKEQINPIVYFCVEYALEDCLPTYAGGLGILAGDIVTEAGKQKIPLVAIGLRYKKGFATYQNKRIYGSPKQCGFNLLKCGNKTILVQAQIKDGLKVFSQVWFKKYGSAKVYLLDPDVDANLAIDRRICENLYPPELEGKLRQEMLLGVGSAELLKILNITPSIYHLNEGHTGFIALALIADFWKSHPEISTFKGAVEKLRPKFVATKHTILPTAGLYFNKQQIKDAMGGYFRNRSIDLDDFWDLGERPLQPEIFSTTRFIIETSARASAVSRLHSVYEKEKYQNSNLIPITNGVSVDRWLAGRFRKKKKLTNAELWKIHENYRHELLDFVFHKTGKRLERKALTIVWARRFALYKRPDLIFSDFDRFSRMLADKNRPVNMIVAGEAGASDRDGIEIMKKIRAYTHKHQLSGRIALLHDYSLSSAQKLTAGADIWLNTPKPGIEACGTSGMKAGLNGALQLSTLDGWIGEVDWSDKGWTLTEDNIGLNVYNVMEQEIIPEFYSRNQNGVPVKWLRRMRKTMRAIRGQFCADRMLNEYFHKLYFPPTN